MTVKRISRTAEKSGVNLRFFRSARSEVVSRTGGAVSESNEKEFGLKRVVYLAGFGSMHKESDAAFKRFDEARAEAEAFLKTQRSAPEFRKQ